MADGSGLVPTALAPRVKPLVMPFEVFEVMEPEASAEAPVVVEVPHASVAVDPRSLATLRVSAHSIGQDADLYVDELYRDAPSLGATLLVARVSRYVCDLNRSESDIDDRAVQGAARGQPAPHGLIWRQSTLGQPALEQPLSRREFERRRDGIYRPYHQRLRELLERKRERFGFALLLAAHSMPSRGRQGHRDMGTPRADVVPGSRGRTTAGARAIDLPDALARARGWSVAHDEPYRGGFTTAHYGKPAERVHAIQVELNRALYMNEDTLEQLPTAFDTTRSYCRELVHCLTQLRIDALDLR